MARDIQRQARLGMAEADVVVLVADARAGLRAGDPDWPGPARLRVPVLVAANKVDRPEDQYMTAELHKLGLGEPLPVSATHGIGSGDLLDRVVEMLGERAPGAEQDEAVRIAVIGRPNAGKSSLVNAFLGAERVIVSDAPERPATRSTPSSRSAAGASSSSTPRGCGGARSRPAASTTTPSCARSGRSSAPTSRSSSATPAKG